MIAHVVLFQPKGELSVDGRREVLAGIAEVVERCPSVRACRVGRRVRHGLPGYEQAMTRDYAYALVLEFDDVSGLRKYLVHPAHQALGEMFTAGAEAALAYDYELMPLADARHAL